MWEVVGKVGSGLALVAFIVAAATTLLRQRLATRERQLLAARDEDRASVIQSLNDSFLISSLPIDPGDLTPDQRFALLLEQIRDRSRRFYVTSILVFALAITIAIVAAIAISKSNNKSVDASATDAEMSRSATPTAVTATTAIAPTATIITLPDTTTTPPTPEPPKDVIVDKIYQFGGPFRITREGDAVSFALTQPILDSTLANHDVTVEEVVFDVHIASESDDPFAFDTELLAFSGSVHARSRMSGADWTTLGELQNSYAPTRRVLQLTIRNDAGRDLHSAQPLVSTIDVSDGVASTGELKKVKAFVLHAPPEGAVFQVFLWTLWGGEHFVDIADIKVHLKLRVRRRAV